MMTAFFAIVYAFASMLLGSMLLLTPLGPPYYAEILWAGGAPAWNYPGLLIVQPWGVVALPFFGTLAMILVSIGVGIGMAVAVLLAAALMRDRRARQGQPAAVGTVAGLTPAMIALVTLGACCSTTAAATAGVWIVGQVSGTSTDNLLLNNWYLGVFQIVVVWVALLAQELLLRVYGGLFDRPERGAPGPEAPSVPPHVDRRSVAAVVVRVGLLIGGLTWSLTMLAEWTVIDPATAPAAMWYSWIVQHQLLAALAIAAALFPRGLLGAVRAASSSVGTRLLRGVLLVGGLTLVVGVPPPFAAQGAGGLGNQIWGVLDATSAWGAGPIVPTSAAGTAFSWILQYALLGTFAVVVALLPLRALRALTPGEGGEGVSESASLRDRSPTHSGGLEAGATARLARSELPAPARAEAPDRPPSRPTEG